MIVRLFLVISLLWGILICGLGGAIMYFAESDDGLREIGLLILVIGFVGMGIIYGAGTVIHWIIFGQWPGDLS